MTKTISANSLAAIVALALSACGGGGEGNTTTTTTTVVSGSDAASCAFITGGGSRVTTSTDPACGACSISNPAAAADGDLNTSASMSVNQAVPAMGAGIRATAQAGIVFPAGSNAGAIMSLPGTSGGETGLVELRTYLSGALQERKTISGNAPCGVCNNGNAAHLERFPTTKPFDAVELFISGASAASTTPAQIYEFCSNSNSGP